MMCFATAVWRAAVATNSRYCPQTRGASPLSGKCFALCFAARSIRRGTNLRQLERHSEGTHPEPGTACADCFKRPLCVLVVCKWSRSCCWSPLEFPATRDTRAMRVAVWGQRAHQVRDDDDGGTTPAAEQQDAASLREGDQRLLHTLRDESQCRAAFSADGRRVVTVGARPGTATVSYSAITGHTMPDDGGVVPPAVAASGMNAAVEGVTCVSPCGLRVAVVTRGSVTVYDEDTAADAAQDRQRRECCAVAATASAGDPPPAVAVAPVVSCVVAAVSSRQAIHLHDTSGNEVARTQLPTTPRCAAFDSSGTLVAVGGINGVVYVMRVCDGSAHRVLTLAVPSDRTHALPQITHVAFSPCGQRLVACHRCVQLFDVTVGTRVKDLGPAVAVVANPAQRDRVVVVYRGDDGLHRWRMLSSGDGASNIDAREANARLAELHPALADDVAQAGLVFEMVAWGCAVVRQEAEPLIAEVELTVRQLNAAQYEQVRLGAAAGSMDAAAFANVSRTLDRCGDRLAQHQVAVDRATAPPV